MPFMRAYFIVPMRSRARLRTATDLSGKIQNPLEIRERHRLVRCFSATTRCNPYADEDSKESRNSNSILWDGIVPGDVQTPEPRSGCITLTARQRFVPWER